MPPINEGAVAKIYVESTKSAPFAVAPKTAISYGNQNNFVTSLQKQGVPKIVVDQLKEKMKLGPLKGFFSKYKLPKIKMK